MPAPEGNQFGVKLKDPEVRQLAFEQYCAHLARGKSQESFYFEHPEFTVSYKTMNRYIEENPEEFPAIKKEIARIKGFAIWEDIVEKSAKGENEAVTPSLQMVMRNKYGWDKVATIAPITEETAVQFNGIMNQLSKHQDERKNSFPSNPS